jgi:hypothetical protein
LREGRGGWGEAVEAVEESGGGQDVGPAAWSGVRRRPGRGWKQQGKVDEKNGGSNKGTDELHVKPCCQTKKNKARVGGRIGPAARERLERTGRRRTRGKIRKRRGPGHEKQKKSENMKPQTEAMDSHVKFNK